MIIVCVAGMLYYGYLYYSIYALECNEKQNVDNIIHSIVIEENKRDDPYNEQRNAIETMEENNIADNISHNDVVSDKSVTAIDIAETPEDLDCIIQIPAIELKKIVYTGVNREEHLKQYELVTASEDMRYVNGMNYIICGHSSRIYGHSLNRLRELKVGDKVIIWNNGMEKQYHIESISYEYMNNTIEFCKQTESRQITIISCAKYVADDTYIVIRCK